VSAAGLPFRTLLLDAHGLSAVAARDQLMGALVAEARRQQARVVIPWTVLAETLHGRGKAERSFAVSKLGLIALTEAHYRDAADLMDGAGMGGHTLDALVVAAARTCDRPVVIATSDPSDVKKLLQKEPGIAVVRA